MEDKVLITVNLKQGIQNNHSLLVHKVAFDKTKKVQLVVLRSKYLIQFATTSVQETKKIKTEPNSLARNLRAHLQEDIKEKV